jgi:hypothetical protein
MGSGTRVIVEGAAEEFCIPAIIVVFARLGRGGKVKGPIVA